MKNSIRYIICAAFFTALLFVGAHASTSSAVYMQYYCTYYSNIYPNLNAAYRAPEGEGFVDGITGSLCTNTVDYRIKGKNGFDIPITRIFKTATSSDDVYYNDYNNKKSVPAYYYAYYTCSEDGETVMITFYNEKELYEADPSFEGVEYSKKSENKYSSLKRSGTGIHYTRVDGRETEVVYKDSYYVYGASIMYSGKSFTDICDTMQIIKPAMYVYDYDNDSDSRDLELVFQDINGNSCTLSAYYRKKNGVFRLNISTYQMASYSKYKLTAVDDNDANVTAVHPLGFSYNTTVTSDDGETYYFLMENFRTYKICGVSDRYGNAYTITDDTYAYIITTSDGEVYTCNSSGITKTAGDTVTQLVSYSRQTVNSAKDVNNKYTIDDEYIFTVTRNSGTSPTISDDEENVIKYYMRQEYRYDKLLNKLDVAVYKLPYKIEFPTGLTKQIEYSSAIGWEIGYPWDKSLTSGYYYCVNRYYEQSGAEIKNEECYAYTFAYNRERPKYRYISQTEKKSMSGGDDVGAETSYMSFDKRINRIEMRDTLAHISGWHKYEYRNDYSDAKVSEETMSQSSQTGWAGAVREYIYNSQNELSQITDGDYVCNYTYHSDAGDTYLLKDTQYKKDAATTVRTENVLTEDKKSIAAQNTYENDELKRTVSYTYDSYGNVASESIDLGSDTALTEYSYAYAADGGYTLTKTQKNIKNSDGESVDNIVTVTVYDSEHRPVSQTDAKGGITSMTYDMSGRLLSVSYPDGTSESYSYDTVNNIVTCTAKNGTVYKIYFNAWGSRTKTVAVLNGAETVLDEYAYNDMGFVSSYKRYTAPGEYTEARYTHDCTGNVLSEKVYETDGTLLREVSYRISISEDSKYNPVTTVTRSISGGGTDFAQYSESTDYLGNIIKRKYTSGANERTYTYTYDLAGNALTETDPLGSVTATAYDVFHNPVSVTYADGSQVSYEYNDLNLVTQKTDALGNISRYEYDAAGRLLNEYNPLADNAEMQSKTDYDANGNVISKKTKQGGVFNDTNFAQTVYSYDSMNRLAYTETFPTVNNCLFTVYSYNSAGSPVSVTTRTGSLTNTSSDRVTAYTYDSLGRMTGETAPDGKTKSYEYDLQGRKLKITDAANMQDTYTYDAFDNVTSRTRGGEAVTYAYNALGKRTSMTDSTGTSTYTYNPFGELTAENKDDILKSYSYDALGRRTSFSAVKGTQSIISNSYTYDVLGRLTAVTNGEDTAAYTYDANSNRLTTTVNGVLKSSAAYNKANLPTEVNSYVSGTLKSTETYRYSYDGLVWQHDKTDLQNSTAGVNYYYYDNIGRMWSEESSLWNTITNEDISEYQSMYLYDIYGNIKSYMTDDTKNDVRRSASYTYNNINQVVSAVKKQSGYDEDETVNNIAYAYDNSNNLTTVTQDGEVIKTYSYDGFNRMSGALVNGVTSSYTYDGDNLRQTKTVNGVQTQHILDGADVIADISGESIKTFVRGAELEFLKTSDGATQEYMTSYPRGDVRYLISQDGTVNDYTYTAYGEKVGTNDNSVNPFGYCGEYFDAETDLVYLRNRYYDPQMHRFITEDPAKDGVNWYAYCNGNPVMFTDPWGTDAIIITNRNSVQILDFAPKGHTSAIYQNENKEWFYTYWGNKAAAVIAIPSEYMDSLVSFNGYISRFLSENECQNITKDYTNATYVVGDFTESLNAAYDDVRNVFNNRFSNGKTVVVGGGNLVYQGHNSPYNPAWNNCLQRTVSDFGKGILPDGTSVSEYLEDCGYSNTLIPNDAKKEFADIFINKSFTYSDSLKSIINYKVNYNVNSKLNTQKSESKYKYANAVCDANPVLSLWKYLK